MKQRHTIAALVAALTIPIVASAEPAAEAEGTAELKARITLAIKLPTLAYEARVAGVAEEDVKATLTAAKDKAVDASNLVEAFQVTLESVKEKGPVENFGAFVTGKLDEGLRGKELAEAIRAEHEARGVGKGKKLGHHEDLLDATGKKYKKGKKPKQGKAHMPGHEGHEGHEDHEGHEGHGKEGAPGQLKDKDDKGLHLGKAADADAKADLKAEKAADKADAKAEKAADKAEKKGDGDKGKPDKIKDKDKDKGDKGKARPGDAKSTPEGKKGKR